MHKDFKELLSILNANGVRYLVVGGYAVGVHAQPRATKDIDLFVKADPTNAAAVMRALRAFGAPLANVSEADFRAPGSFFRMGVPPVMVDILPDIGGVDFDDAYARRIDVTIDRAANLIVPYISADDLIAAKLAAGRPQDLLDVAAIRKARARVARASKAKGKKPPKKRRGP